MSKSSSSPAYSKILIGAGASLAEGVILGHGMEQLKIVRQATALSYAASIKHAYVQRGLLSVLYRGFWPFGSLQAITKGLPVLFIEHEVSAALLIGAHHNIVWHSLMGSDSRPARCSTGVCQSKH